jgi:hypothetical protein
VSERPSASTSGIDPDVACAGGDAAGDWLQARRPTGVEVDGEVLDVAPGAVVEVDVVVVDVASVDASFFELLHAATTSIVAIRKIGVPRMPWVYRRGRRARWRSGWGSLSSAGPVLGAGARRDAAFEQEDELVTGRVALPRGPRLGLLVHHDQSP